MADNDEAPIEQWELCKENFVPVKTGRSKSALQEMLVEPAVESVGKGSLEEKRRCVATMWSAALE